MPTEHFDVLVIGAGISGIGGAYHLRQQCPGSRFVVLESQPSFGGTWLTHRYPGVRSDSDLYTFGYRFKPWTGAPIASGAEIMRYLGEVIDENQLGEHIRYQHTVSSAGWCSDEQRWTLDVILNNSGERRRFKGKFLWMCQGYYRHSEGYTPDWPGISDFKGQIVHPQTWPDALDYAGKNVVVIGSGATAATLIPALAEQSAQVTMLQRSPTYFVTGRNANVLADTLRQLEIKEEWIHEIVRRKILFDQATIYRRAFSEPQVLKQELLAGVRAFLGPDYDVETHFTPSYLPWRQRIAFIPDGDLFKVIRDGKAEVVTDQIERFTASGLALKSGKQLAADIIVTATGFDLNVLGDINFTIDGTALDFAKTISYRGAMFTGVPNLVWIFGYFRASWTLRTDLIADFVCRLINRMSAQQVSQVTATLRATDRDMQLSPWVSPENFNPGYLMRGLHLLPQQGDIEPWRHKQDYWTEKDELPAADLDDGTLVYR
jgi:cation diffusion facilitator CzcD-associated flavoprotein CzcO